MVFRWVLWIPAIAGCCLPLLLAIATPVQSAPSASPDGLIVFSEYTGQQLFLIKPDGTGETPLTKVGQGGHFPCWSPDGTAVLFQGSGEYPVTDDLYTIRADGSGLTRLVMINTSLGRGYNGPCRYSPDGTHILYGSSQNGLREVTTENVPQPGISIPNTRDISGWGTYSPDGKWIAVSGVDVFAARRHASPARGQWNEPCLEP